MTQIYLCLDSMTKLMLIFLCIEPLNCQNINVHWQIWQINLRIVEAQLCLEQTSDRYYDTVHTLTPTWHPCSHLWEHQCYISLISIFERNCHLWMVNHRVVSLLVKIMCRKNALLPLHRISFSHYSGKSIPTIICYALFIYALPFLTRLPLLLNTVHWHRKITEIKLYLEGVFFQIPGKQSEHICCRLQDSPWFEFQKACDNIIAVSFRKHYIRDTF